MDLQSYEAEVKQAFVALTAGYLGLPDATRPEDVHRNVAEAHAHLHRLCKRYRRHRMFRYLVVWSEREAVAFGYLRFDEVEKP